MAASGPTFRIVVGTEAITILLGQQSWSLPFGRAAGGGRTLDIRELRRLKQDGVEMTVPEMARLLRRIELELEQARIPVAVPRAEAAEFRWRFRWRSERAKSFDGTWEVVLDRSGRAIVVVAGPSWRLEMGAIYDDPADLPDSFGLCVSEGLMWVPVCIPLEPTGYDLCEYVSAASRALVERKIDVFFT